MKTPRRLTRQESQELRAEYDRNVATADLVRLTWNAMNRVEVRTCDDF